MKLLYCPLCQDIMKIGGYGQWRHCQCGASCGRYLADGLHAEYGGMAVPLGIGNLSFQEALKGRPDGPGEGELFDAFVIPQQCETVTVVEPRCLPEKEEDSNE